MFGPLNTGVEILRRPFTANELFDLVENSSVREPLRKYQPNHFAIFVNEAGAVEGVARSQYTLSLPEFNEASAQFPGAAYFLALPGLYSGPDVFAAKIESCAAALRESPGRGLGGGAWLKIGAKWIPSIGTRLLHRAKSADSPAPSNVDVTSRPERPLRTLTRTLLVSILLFACVGCDQASKGAARAYLVPGEAQSFLHDTLRLIYVENPGAFLSMGADLPDHARSTIFMVGVGLLSLGALFAALYARRLSQWQVIALALIASGGVGNWIDRLTNEGRVTDFLNVGVGGLRTGIFNVADMVLVAGVALYLLASRGVQLNR